MNILTNLHTHTTYSDGANTAEEYILAAVSKGFRSIGFSDHAYNSYDLDCRLEEENIPSYIGEVIRLREKYAEEIEIYLGIENDYFEPVINSAFHYVIGSAHYVRKEGKYYSIDYLPALLEEAAAAFGGMQTLIEIYYAQVADLALRQKPEILGHMDLIAKFNRDAAYFDAQSPWYRRLLDEVIAAVASSGCIVELNSGGMYRGYMDVPYPCAYVLKRLCQAGVPITFSSDAHCVAALDHAFPEMARLAYDAGYRSYRELSSGSFSERPLA